MKKTKVVLLAVGILLLAGCGNQVEKNQNENKGEAQNQEREQEQNRNGIVGSIKDAMGLGKTMRCTYRIKNQDGEMEVVTYVDGGKYATEMNIAGNKQRMVYNEEAMYTWQEGQKQGMKMTKACTEELNKDLPESNESDVPEEDVTGEKFFEDAMDVKCEEFSNADFSVPTNVEFSDQCEMLKGIMKNIPGGAGGQNGTDMPGGIPKGINMSNIPKM